MQRTKRRLSRLLLVPLLLFSAFSTLIPVSFASTPTIHNEQHNFCTSAVTTCAIPALTITQGDLIVVSDYLGSCIQGVTYSLSDNHGGTYTTAVSTGETNPSAGYYVTKKIDYTTAPNFASIIITLTLSQSNGCAGATGGSGLEVYSFSGGYTGAAPATGTGSGTGTVPATSSTPFSGTVLLIGTLQTSQTPSAGTGYTIAPFYNGEEYALSGVSSPTTFPWTQTPSGAWWAIGAEFDFGGQIPVVVIAACNFFQLQCWWYPLFFMALYSGFMLMVASFVKASPKGKSHIFLSAVTFGSLLAVILGVMNIVFPLLMLILNTIIILRLRN